MLTVEISTSRMVRRASARIASDCGLGVALITNGLKVTDEAAAQMAALGLTHVGISVDGATDADLRRHESLDPIEVHAVNGPADPG